jgi:tRNA threonylcarbamoyladenosine dehydratase
LSEMDLPDVVSAEPVAPGAPSATGPEAADAERRFGGLRRLYGETGYLRLRDMRVAVVGLGGVGSWTAEALARCGVAELVLIDLDHVAESNINRQVQAVGATVGMAKTTALAHRIADIHPACRVSEVEAFVEPENWPGLLPHPVDVVVDACDCVRAKAALAAWAVGQRQALVCCGAAGGKRQAQGIEVADLAAVTHDPLLASLRSRLRREHGAARTGVLGVSCVFSREAVQAPADTCSSDGSLNCHGYGSSIVVTASFGLAAAGEAIRLVLAVA